MKKRGSLELSVNAIVIFIIAFAMLGVGLFFINKVRTAIDIDPKSFLPPDQMKYPPSSENPLTIESIKIKSKAKMDTLIGVYAKNEPISGVKFVVKSCTNAESNKKISLPDTSGIISDLSTMYCEDTNVAGTPS